MRFFYLFFIFICFCSTCFAASAKEMCAGAKMAAKQQNAKAPYKVDKNTELIEMRVNCKYKTIFTIKVIIDKKYLPNGWIEIWQKKHTKRNCSKKGLAGGFGWTATSNIYDKNSNHIAIISTTPKDC